MRMTDHEIVVNDILNAHDFVVVKIASDNHLVVSEIIAITEQSKQTVIPRFKKI